MTTSTPTVGWVPVRESLPEVGERVQVRHIGNPSYDCTGYVDSSGTWQCQNAFLLPNMMLAWNPTHWRPAPPSGDVG